LPVDRRHALYAGAAGGYYMRSLRWGGEAAPVFDEYPFLGTLVRELKNWGFALKVGWQRQLFTSNGKPRLIDIQLRYESYGPQELYFEELRLHYASGRDNWIALSCHLLTGL
jgi:hypothetical protein